MISLIEFLEKLSRDKEMLLTLENFKKIYVKEFILVMLQVSSLQL